MTRCEYLESVARPMFTCRHCGAECQRNRNGRTKGWFCSRKCAALARSVVASAAAAVAKAAPRQCIECAQPFERSSRGQRICSRHCLAARARRRAQQRYTPKTRCGVCPQCAQPWEKTGIQGTVKFCSSRCARQAMYRQRGGGTHAQRAKAKGAPRRFNIKPPDVFARDGWRCQLCGCKTPRHLRGTFEPDAPELDHIIPIGACGGHVLENLQCACRRCNGAKGDRPLGQLRLM